MTDNMTTIPIISPDAADERPVAIYVHGLASGAVGTTFNTLAKKFTQYRWITTDFGETIDGNVAILESMVRMHRPSLVVGTSMGGVTMLYANTPDTVKIVCNPALSIADSVRHTIGLGEHEYFCERIDGKQSFVLTEEMCLGYEDYIANHTPQLGKENYAIFSEHDELLGKEATQMAQQVVSEVGYNVIVDPKGVHRITTSTIKLIGDIINSESK